MRNQQWLITCKLARMALSVLFAVTVVSCAPETKSAGEANISSIVGKDDRTLVASSDPMNMVVGGVGQAGTPFCTAFKIDTNEYITARHCIVDENGDTLSNLQFMPSHSIRNYSIQAFLRIDEKADLAYFAVEGYDNGAKLGLANSTNQNKNLTVYSAVVNSSDSKVQLIMDTKCTFLRQDPESGLIIHACDTESGSSGSPIFADGKVIGIHLGSMHQELAHNSGEGVTENVACSLGALNETDVTKLPYEGERCRCSVRCPGRCVPNLPSLPSLDSFKKGILNQLTNIGVAAVAGESEEKGWTTSNCATLGSGAIAAAVTPAYTAICAAIGLSTAGTGVAPCAAWIVGTTGTVVGLTCTSLCNDHKLRDCK